MGSKGSQAKNESTSTATSAPNAQAGALYGDILTRLGNYADQNPNAPVYQGERVAQFTPDQLAAMGTVNQAQGAYQPYMQQAGQFAQQAGSAITPGQINAAMNPYQQQVIDATMAQMSEKNAQQMSALKGTEAQRGAFGGSRAAVTEAMLGGQQNMNMASTLAGLNNQNYNQAIAQGQANRAAAGTGAQLQSGLGTQSMQLPFMGAQQQAQQGALQQRLAQQNLDVPYQNFLQEQAYTPQMLQFMASLGTGVGSQMGGTTTNTGQTTNTPAQPNPWMQAAGLGLSAAAMFSDKRAKENIEPVGHLNDGQKIYKYNYKGDPHTQIGLIAQEVERKHPEAVGESNGLKTVNYDLATRNAIHKADGGSVGSDIVGNAVRMARQMREGMAGGGVPGAGVGTSEYMGHNIPAIFPTSQMAMGKGAPSTPGFVSSPEMKNPNSDMKGLGAGLGALAKAGYDKFNGPTTPTGYTGNTTDPFAGQPDATTSYMGGIPYPMFGKSLGGTVSPESAYHGFAHKAYGGSLFDPTPISEQGGEDPNKAPVMPPEGFMDQPPSIVPAGEFKPYEAPPQADSAPVPMPRPRPESLRVNDLAAAAPVPIGADAVPMPPPSPAQTAVPPTGGIFTRVLRTESNGRQLDKNGNPLMSPKGAIGIAQIMPTTGPEAANLARLPWDEQRFKYDANYNAALGKAYFDHQTKVFGGDPEKGAAAYNAGPGRLREAMAMAAANGGSYKDYLPAETQNYLGKIFGQPQAGLGERANGSPLAFNGNVRQDIGDKYAGTPIEVRGKPEQGGLALPYAGGDVGGGTVVMMARKAAERATTPAQLAQNASILERLTGIQLSDAGRQALMAAGLRMMTTPGDIGTVLGTAGMQGMATYSEAKQLEQAQIEAQRKQAFEREKFERPFREMTAQQKLQEKRAAEVEKRSVLTLERGRYVESDRSTEGGKNVFFDKDANQFVTFEDGKPGPVSEDKMTPPKTESGRWTDTGMLSEDGKPILRDTRTGRMKTGELPSGAGKVTRAPTAAEAAAEKTEAQTTAKIRANAKATIPAAENVQRRAFELIDNILYGDKFAQVTGLQAWFPTIQPSSVDTEEKINQLSGNAFVNAFESLKGGGAISEKEGAAATSALARLKNLKQSDEGYKEALLDFRKELHLLTNVVRQKAGMEPISYTGPELGKSKSSAQEKPKTIERQDINGKVWKYKLQPDGTYK